MINKENSSLSTKIRTFSWCRRWKGRHYGAATSMCVFVIYFADNSTKSNFSCLDNILGTTSTTDPIPTSHDQLAHLSLIIGVIAAALGVVVLGSLYILICKHHRGKDDFLVLFFSFSLSFCIRVRCDVLYFLGCLLFPCVVAVVSSQLFSR